MNAILNQLKKRYGFEISPSTDVNVIDKLDNMYESEITSDVYEYITEKHPELIEAIEKEILMILADPKSNYEFSNADEIYDCDALYMISIINTLNEHGNKKVVTETKCGYGAIDLIS